MPSGTFCPLSKQLFLISSVMLFGAKNLMSLQSTIDEISAFDAISQISPKSVSGAISFLTLCIIHSPIMFFRYLNLLSYPPSLVKFISLLSSELSAFVISVPIKDQVPELI